MARLVAARALVLAKAALLPRGAARARRRPDRDPCERRSALRRGGGKPCPAAGALQSGSPCTAPGQALRRPGASGMAAPPEAEPTVALRRAGLAQAAHGLQQLL